MGIIVRLLFGKKTRLLLERLVEDDAMTNEDAEEEVRDRLKERSGFKVRARFLQQVFIGQMILFFSFFSKIYWSILFFKQLLTQQFSKHRFFLEVLTKNRQPKLKRRPQAAQKRLVQGQSRPGGLWPRQGWKSQQGEREGFGSREWGGVGFYHMLTYGFWSVKGRFFFLVCSCFVPIWSYIYIYIFVESL